MNHTHSRGLRDTVREIFAPHSHAAAADSVDDALESSRIGIRAVKISLNRTAAVDRRSG